MKKTFILITLLTVFNSHGENTDFYFSPDERLFTAFAFMNAAGFNGEFRDEGMNPIRLEIRSLVKGKLDQEYLKRIRKFHRKTMNWSWSSYAPAALSLGSSPEFELSIDQSKSDVSPEVIENAKALSALLKEFYDKAEIKRIWGKYKEQLEVQNLQYKPYSNVAFQDIKELLNVNHVVQGERGYPVHFMVCPQMSYFTAQQCTINGVLYIISGPRDGEPSKSLFYHEALHEVVNPAVDAHLELLMSKSDLFEIQLIYKNPRYDDWVTLTHESFVRTIDMILQGKEFNHTNERIEERVYDEYRLGFTLSPYIYERIKRETFEDISFSKFVRKCIADIDIEREKSRLEEFWKEKN